MTIFSHDELRKHKRFELLQTLYDYAAGSYNNKTNPDQGLMAKCLAEMEKLVFDDVAFGGGNAHG